MACLAACAGDEAGSPEAEYVPADSMGVEITALEEFRPCGPCALAPVEEVRLGDTLGPGMAEGESATLRFDPSTRTFAVVWSGQNVGEIDLFDESGTYLRSVGRPGEGPGEFPRPPWRFLFRDGHLVVLQSLTMSWAVFRDDGSFVEEWPVDVPRSSRFVELSPDSVVLVADGARERAGSLVSLSERAVLGEVPEAPFALPENEGLPPMLLPVVPGRTPSTIASGSRHEFAVREWSLDGDLLRVMRGHVRTLPVVPGTQTEEGEPPTSLSSFRFDEEGRLWTITQVPAETWREYHAGFEEFRAGRTGPIGVPVDFINSLPRRTAPRLDVIDLKRGVHLGTWVSEARYVGFLEKDGELMLYQLELDETLNPTLALYRFELEGSR